MRTDSFLPAFTPRTTKLTSPPPHPQDHKGQQGRTGKRGGGRKQSRSGEPANTATLKMAARPWRGPSEAVPTHAQRGVPARDTRWRQRRWGGRGGGGKTGGRAERVAASPRVRFGQVRAPGSHGPAASRARVRESQAGRQRPLRRFPLGAAARPVSFVAAILEPRVGSRAAGLGECSGPGEHGRSGLEGPSAAAAVATAFVSGSDSESPQPGGGSARQGGGRSPGDGPARAHAEHPAPAGLGEGCAGARAGGGPGCAPAPFAGPVAPPAGAGAF